MFQAMNKLDDQVASSYQKLLAKDEEEPRPPGTGKQSVFSPYRKGKQATPIKSSTYKTPSKADIEQQKYLQNLNF